MKLKNYETLFSLNFAIFPPNSSNVQDFKLIKHKGGIINHPRNCPKLCKLYQKGEK